MKEKFRAIKLLYSSAMGRNGIIYPHSSRKRASRLIPSTATNTALISCHTRDCQDASKERGNFLFNVFCFFHIKTIQGLNWRRFETKRVRQMYTIFCVLYCCYFLSQSGSSSIHGFGFRCHQEEQQPVLAPVLSCPLPWRGPSLVNQLKTNLAA